MANLFYFVYLCVVQTKVYTDCRNKEEFCVEMQAYSWTNHVLGVTKTSEVREGYLLVNKEFFKAGKSHSNENMVGREKALKKIY